MNFDQLADFVSKIYLDKNLSKVTLQDLMKQRKNNGKMREIIKIRIDFRYTHMSGKEQLDNMLKRAYLFDFPVVSKEKQHVVEINDLQQIIELVEGQLNNLYLSDNPDEDTIDRKRNEKTLLQQKLNDIIALEPKDDEINLNGVAIKILRMLEKGDDDSRRLHNVVKYRVCGTTSADDMAIRKDMIKYLAGSTKEDEENKIAKIDKSIKQRESSNRYGGGDRGGGRGGGSSGRGYVPPHLRPRDDIQIQSDAHHVEQIIPCVKSEGDFPTLAQAPLVLVGVWGKKSFADLLKSDTSTATLESETSEPTIKIVAEKKAEKLSSTIEVVCDKSNNFEQIILKTMDIEDWTNDD
jgi:hypothetical protein